MKQEAMQPFKQQLHWLKSPAHSSQVCHLETDNILFQQINESWFHLFSSSLSPHKNTSWLSAYRTELRVSTWHEQNLTCLTDFIDEELVNKQTAKNVAYSRSAVLNLIGVSSSLVPHRGHGPHGVAYQKFKKVVSVWMHWAWVITSNAAKIDFTSMLVANF